MLTYILSNLACPGSVPIFTTKQFQKEASFTLHLTMYMEPHTAALNIVSSSISLSISFRFVSNSLIYLAWSAGMCWHLEADEIKISHHPEQPCGKCILLQTVGIDKLGYSRHRLNLILRTVCLTRTHLSNNPAYICEKECRLLDVYLWHSKSITYCSLILSVASFIYNGGLLRKHVWYIHRVCVDMSAWKH